MFGAVKTELPVLPSPRFGLDAPDVRDAVAAAAVLADPIRAGIVGMLARGPYCVCELASALAARENNVSNHLGRLREAGLVRAARHEADARWIYYELDDDGCGAALASLVGLVEAGR